MMTPFLLIVTACFSIFVVGCRRSQNQPASQPQSTGSRIESVRSNPEGEVRFDVERYDGVDVVAKTALVKLDRCDIGDDTIIINSLSDFAKTRTQDENASVRQIGNFCWFLISTSSGKTSDLIQILTTEQPVRFYGKDGNPVDILEVEPNFIIELDPQVDKQTATILPDDDLFAQGKLWGLANRDYSGIDVHAVDAWKTSQGSAEIAVAVVDTGVDFNHLDLKDNIWSAPEEFEIKLNRETIKCPKDSHGYNAVATDEKEKCIPDESGPKAGHGTHVAGIIGGMGYNQFGIKGVNWTTKLVGLKYMGRSGGTVEQAVKAIEFAVQLRNLPENTKVNIRVLNASWGYYKESKMLREELERAADILIVASAGEEDNDNDKTFHYPSNYVDLTNLISVTAIDRKGSLALIHGAYANVGKNTVHLGAPGKGIYSTYPRDKYFEDSGTSMATPFVSGAAALLLSTEACKNLSSEALRSSILKGTDPTSSLSKTVTRGRLNISKSMMKCN